MQCGHSKWCGASSRAHFVSGSEQVSSMARYRPPIYSVNKHLKTARSCQASMEAEEAEIESKSPTRARG